MRGRFNTRTTSSPFRLCPGWMATPSRLVAAGEMKNIPLCVLQNANHKLLSLQSSQKWPSCCISRFGTMLMNLFRQVAERLSRDKVFRRRLPQQYGAVQFYISPECGLRYLRGKVELVDPTLLNLARELVKPGATVWDVGANLGLFSFAAAGLAGPGGRVFAVEPDMYLVGLLRRSARLKNDHAAPVSVIPCAVSEEISLAVFNIAERARTPTSSPVMEKARRAACARVNA
jgi:hypothetical protein